MGARKSGARNRARCHEHGELTSIQGTYVDSMVHNITVPNHKGAVHGEREKVHPDHFGLDERRDRPVCPGRSWPRLEAHGRRRPLGKAAVRATGRDGEVAVDVDGTASARMAGGHAPGGNRFSLTSPRRAATARARPRGGAIAWEGL